MSHRSIRLIKFSAGHMVGNEDIVWTVAPQQNAPVKSFFRQPSRNNQDLFVPYNPQWIFRVNAGTEGRTASFFVSIESLGLPGKALFRKGIAGWLPVH